MKHYLDSSVVLAMLLEGSRVLQPLQNEPHIASSRLLWVEVSRVIERAVRTGRLSTADAVGVRRNFERFAEGLSQLKLHEPVFLRAAGPYPVVIKTLDALHLASAELWLQGAPASGLAVWTFDYQMNLCTASLGFQTPLLETQ